MKHTDSHPEHEHYLRLLDSIKARIHSAQHQIAMYVNSELLFTYWNIGHTLNVERDRKSWGARVVDNLARDLKLSFPTMKGLSKRNLQYMMRFAEEWSLDCTVPPIVPPVVAQLQNTDYQQDTFVPPLAAQFEIFEKNAFSRVPWSHHRLLLDKIDDPEERTFYCEQIVSNNWSKRVLLNKLGQKLYKSHGQLSNNFIDVLPPDQATLVQETFKDPYFFDFLQLGNEASEREIERTLVSQIGQFLLELGSGFAYMGKQYKIEIGGKEYFLDLLFFHTGLNCYVNIELKIDEFKPEYAGKSQFYLTAIDKHVKLDHHNPSVGVILCKAANKIVVEYTLKQSGIPLGVAEYQLVQELPERLHKLIPAVDELKENLKRM